ncbi:MAG: hypothetical protein IK131_07520 [Paludibacteraceae bacterium]|nr:hypothetical protein [Paludibacteraceae bacterium]
MYKRYFKGMTLSIDSKFIRMDTEYELYDHGCQTIAGIPAFRLPRYCNDEDFLNSLKICYESSGGISNKEYDDTGGWDAVQKELKIRSLKQYYLSSVGFSLKWEQKEDANVHIDVWVSEGKSYQTTSGDSFYLKYDENSIDEFVVNLRRIMEEMYEKHQVKSNSEIRRIENETSQAEIKNALRELKKLSNSSQKIALKKYGWNHDRDKIWKVEGGYYFILEHLDISFSATLYVKPLYIDNLWLKIFDGTEENEPISSASVEGVRLMEFPLFKDINERSDNCNSTYSLDKIRHYSEEETRKVWNSTFQQLEDVVNRFLQENPDPDSYFPGEDVCKEEYTLLTYLHSGDKQKVLKTIAKFRDKDKKIYYMYDNPKDSGIHVYDAMAGWRLENYDKIEAWCKRN